MKILLIVTITATILGGYALAHIFSERKTSPRQPGSVASRTDTPFFCDRTALTPEQRKRQQELGHTLASSVLGIQELPDGLEFEFPPDSTNYQTLAEFTPLERACCPFFDISIRLEREGGKLWWRLTGRDGVKQFIRAEFPSWIKR